VTVPEAAGGRLIRESRPKDSPPVVGMCGVLATVALMRGRPCPHTPGSARPDAVSRSATLRAHRVRRIHGDEGREDY
jgi:hypothetical protein